MELSPCFCQSWVKVKLSSTFSFYDLFFQKRLLVHERRAPLWAELLNLVSLTRKARFVMGTTLPSWKQFWMRFACVYGDKVIQSVKNPEPHTYIGANSPPSQLADNLLKEDTSIHKDISYASNKNRSSPSQQACAIFFIWGEWGQACFSGSFP